MIINNLTLKNYRNYIDQSVVLGPKINIIYGNNAEGKTNLLEAIYFFCMGKSHRTSNDREIINFNSDSAYISICYKDKTRDNILEIEFQNLSRSIRKNIQKNGIKVNKLSELIDSIKVVMFSPEDLNLVKEGPEARRRFLDICISQIRPNYLYNLKQYQKVLQHRNNILKEGKLELLESFTEKLVEYGVLITKYRHEYLKRLRENGQKTYADICRGKEEFDLEYLHSCCDNMENIREEFINKLRENKQKEIRMFTSLIGPHRDDIKFSINGNNAKQYASQGQQRSIVLAAKLAEAEIISEEYEYPVILLDDIMSELDINRQNDLMHKIEGAQVIITCTNVNGFKINEDFKLFKVEKGKICV